ncbi:GNAT family N-acetyltransferase [Aliiroseovarius sp. M344]|uniref:GNAT family N-acetyltransferase n=1 Tax=Aliiroseovarius sp. M344 TaxID=2867010 RepID=UPI0021AD72E0|nr:GNAT family N-acetyltransferase [Aliiroseovarius sp. M344]UWQ14805.1 GNAT family N-acetyltransferase [Aliiroseovarius sp. M344]
MIRVAQPGDEAAIEGFLKQHAATSMFLRSNLANLGLAPSASPRSTEFWLFGAPDLRGVIGFSKAGFVMCEVPDLRLCDWQEFAAAVEGRTVAGIMGDPTQVDLGKRGLGIDAAAYSTDREEPLYRLPLDGLITPDGVGKLRPATDDDLDMLVEWVIDYDLTAFGLTLDDRVRRRARETAQAHIASDNHRILECKGVPVAKTAFNATLPDMVQIGGVYTPPCLRSKGYARRAVALHLREAQGKGVKTAILFASGEPACRAYEAIGFQKIGSHTLAILAEPQVIGAGV